MFTNRMSKRIAVAALCFSGLVALGATYEIAWRSIDGGAGESRGGTIAVAGTIGQPDVGAMSGGDYAVVGGFWSVPAEPSGGCTRDPMWLCDGDVDGDGQVNPVDSGLVQAAFCSGDDCSPESLCQYDMDCDGQINPVDAGIVQSLFGVCARVRPVCP